MEFDDDKAKRMDQSAEHQFQMIKWEHETAAAARTEYAKFEAEAARVHLAATKEYGILCLKNLFLLNGGALVAMLAFVGNVAEKHAAIDLKAQTIVNASACFVGGLVCTVVGAFCGYLNFQAHVDETAGHGHLANFIVKTEGQYPIGRRHPIFIPVTAWVAVVAGVAALGFFMAGCWAIWLGLRGAAAL